MKKLFLFLLIINVYLFIEAKNILDLNFFIEPEIHIDKQNEIKESVVKSTRNDSITYLNIFAGKIFRKTVPDSLLLSFLNEIDCNLASPTDYKFNNGPYLTKFKIISSNIFSDNMNIIENKIIKTDSMRIGIFSIYTPDFMVKNNITSNIDFKYNVFTVTKKQVKYLKDKTDYLIMLSNLSKYIDKDIVKNLPVDVIISFDYKKMRNEFINNKTKFFSILSKKGKFGRLRIIYEKGKIKSSWKEIKF